MTIGGVAPKNQKLLNQKQLCRHNQMHAEKTRAAPLGFKPILLRELLMMATTHSPRTLLQDGKKRAGPTWLVEKS